MLAGILRWMVVVAATVNFGYMGFDGARATITGDYIRPESGQYAGQLGPLTLTSAEPSFIGPHNSLSRTILQCELTLPSWGSKIYLV